MGNAFYTTRDYFREATQYKGQMSYDEWVKCPDDHKAAVLYLQFFEQITLAWYKVRSFYGSEEEGVETILQYLMKNVPIIKNNQKKFTSNYVYRVAYNCLYCICHDRISDKMRYELEVSNICVCSDTGDELDLFDTVTNYEDPADVIEKKEFWEKISKLGESAIEVVHSIIDKGEVDEDMRKNDPELIQQLSCMLAEYVM